MQDLFRRMSTPGEVGKVEVALRIFRKRSVCIFRICSVRIFRICGVVPVELLVVRLVVVGI